MENCLGSMQSISLEKCLGFCILNLSGPNCEIDVSICNATENKCSNGGQCIDGLGAAFFCYCPSGKWMNIIQNLH